MPLKTRQVNRYKAFYGLLRPYFVEFGLDPGISGILGPYFRKKRVIT